MAYTLLHPPPDLPPNSGPGYAATLASVLSKPRGLHYREGSYLTPPRAMQGTLPVAGLALYQALTPLSVDTWEILPEMGPLLFRTGATRKSFRGGDGDFDSLLLFPMAATISEYPLQGSTRLLGCLGYPWELGAANPPSNLACTAYSAIAGTLAPGSRQTLYGLGSKCLGLYSLQWYRRSCTVQASWVPRGPISRWSVFGRHSLSCRCQNTGTKLGRTMEQGHH